MKCKFIKEASDLITSRKATREGFLEQALQKIDKSEPYVKKAIEFRKEIQKLKSVDELLALDNFKNELLTSVGFSTKAIGHISSDEIDDILKNALEVVRKKYKDHFHDEILFRYLLIKGDALGGSMRNLTGLLGQNALVKAIMKALRTEKINPTIDRSANKIHKIAWGKRCIVFDRMPKLIKKNIDVILLNVSSGEPITKLIEQENSYIACGELKGGVDPAGADEHWKTTRSSLERIKDCFNDKTCPKLFFVAAAIEASMAQEIFDKLSSGYLSFAANLTVEEQVRDLAVWLVSL